MGLQLSCILVISHFFHLVLKALGQPGPIAQIFVSVSIYSSLLNRTFHVIFDFAFIFDLFELFRPIEDSWN